MKADIWWTGYYIISTDYTDPRHFIRGYALSYPVSDPIRLGILVARPQTIATAMLFRPINQPAKPAQA